MDAGIDLAPREPLHRGLVHRAGAREGSDERGPDTGEWSTHGLFCSTRHEAIEPRRQVHASPDDSSLAVPYVPLRATVTCT